MKSFRRAVIAAMLAAAPALAVSTAWANTELVPGSRLVAPYWDVSGDRTTLMFITNVSRRANLTKGATPATNCNLGGAAATSGSSSNNMCAVHLEFYDKTCDNTDLTIDLTKQDIDQLDIAVDTDLGGVRGLPSKLGWLDADVRRAISGSGHTNTGVQANVLAGTVIITDSGSNFAVGYPMAASQGSSNAGVGGDIVSRDNQGDANVWTGGYESFPARVYVPMFFAEGNNYGQTFSSTLAIAGPAQSVSLGEAPGQDLKDDPLTTTDEGVLISAEVDVIDACENPQSDDIDEHYVYGTLEEIFIPQVTAPYLAACGYPARDVDRVPATTTATAFQGGFIDITNNAVAGLWSGGTKTGNGIERGMVGVLVQQTTQNGDATRLWGDCAYGINGAGSSATSGCRQSFSLVNSVAHTDLLP